MAKVNHNNYQESISEVARNARRHKCTHLVAGKSNQHPKTIQLEERSLTTFFSNGYLAIEQDPRLVEGSVEYTREYGVQFAVSRAFVTSEINKKLEHNLSEMFDHRPVLTYTSTTLAHISALPCLIHRNDFMILDQQVHFSVQSATHLVMQTGTAGTMIRHNNLEMLERKIKQIQNKYEKIWYFIDGVYSMFGDLAPKEELLDLLNKYPQLHIYCDDAHGIGWCGSNGSGSMFDFFRHSDRFILSTTLCKGFGTQGGLLVFPNEKEKDKVRLFGGPLSYSHPMQPPLIGAAMAASEIMLSPEIEEIQASMSMKMAHFQKQLVASNLPIVSHPQTPIFYVGMGKPKTSYNMVERLKEEGYMVSTGLFPAVPMKCSGLRISLNNARTTAEIDGLVAAIAKHYPYVLEEEEITDASIRHAFGMEVLEAKDTKAPGPIELPFEISWYNSIEQVDQEEWDLMMMDKGVFDYVGLQDQERIFQNNPVKQNNFEFYYLIIRDYKSKKPIVASFLSHGTIKDDMLDPSSISFQIENTRKKEPEYLTSTCLMLGTVLTEGNHLFLDRSHAKWETALKIFISQIQSLNQRLGANTVMLRDMDAQDEIIKTVFTEEGFVPVAMPNANVTALNWNSFKEFYESVSSKKRKLLKNEIVDFQDHFKVKIITKLSPTEQCHFYSLYKNITNKNLDINLFDYPADFLSKMQSDNWEILSLHIRPSLDEPFSENAVAFVCAYKGKDSYSPIIGGLDYTYVESHQSYKQILYRALERGFELNKKRIYFGLSADQAKRKVGCVAIPKVAYVQITDNFHREVIAAMATTTQTAN